ncbi:hypothetical protein [Neomoorella mulderi]|uniref:Uncharacterized protein n=1 Tax=Moorella mulderi DSM 14980 TaxID=1122241 RepID=A0A151ATU6_9FIRM|nr:hypothetical protein [Moorella mulderi]KYH30970.1 hypothetical protein MOMUL_27540 [Moorella mulderi DSM 14980]
MATPLPKNGRPQLTLYKSEQRKAETNSNNFPPDFSTGMGYNELEEIIATRNRELIYSLMIYILNRFSTPGFIEALTETAATNEEGQNMDWQEKYLDKLDRDFSEIKAEFHAMRSELQASAKATEERVARIVDQALGEMRDRDNQRHQAFLDIRNFLAEERRWVIAMAVTTILGVAAMVIAILLKG